ncbi:hypothetical protein GF354_05885 [Candidatus Peregrinibacteria bacterium]|nr:hypothetical protein [Candidatus Peregrinibacteria bacterium]
MENYRDRSEIDLPEDLEANAKMLEDALLHEGYERINRAPGISAFMKEMGPRPDFEIYWPTSTEFNESRITKAAVLPRVNRCGLGNEEFELLCANLRDMGVCFNVVSVS